MTAKNEVRLLSLNEAGKENVEAVAKLLTDQNIRTIWVKSSQVLSCSCHEEDVIYIVDPTQGKEVDHLVKLGFSVIGSQCALTVLKHNILLKKDLRYPIHNLTMLGCLICFSNIDPKIRSHLCQETGSEVTATSVYHSEAELRHRVERMGGKVTGSLTHDVSHLVVKEVGSVKYFSAARVGIPIMVLDWIEHLWKHGQSRYISAKDGKWEEFQCPIFLGCSVCVTGFSTAERNRMQKLITKFGGIYSGAMKLDFTTHLVVHKPEGQKYQMAHRFGVKVVGIDWVYKSVEKGFCQDHNNFPVQPPGSISTKPNSSTPERNDVKMPNLNDMSNISVMTVNETVAPSDMSTLSTIHAPVIPSKVGKVDLLNFPLGSLHEQILDGISVFTAGFSVKEEEQLHKILMKSGATRCKQLSAVVSHVLIGSSSALSDNIITSIQTALQSDHELWIVSYKWLLASLRKGEVLSEFDFWDDFIAPKPSHAEAEQSTFIQPEKSAAVDAARFSAPAPGMQDVLSQYMGGDTTLLRNFNIEDPRQDADQPSPHHDEQSSVANDSRWCFFQEFTFIVENFSEEDHNRCVESIESLGGRILPSYSKKVADYALIPVVGTSFDRTAKYVVTDFWLDSCLADGKLLEPDFHPMASPFPRHDHTPLEGCVTSLSKYQEPERSHLVGLMRTLGAIYQDNVARKDMPPLHQTTHLIVLSPEGDKYVGCKKWEIPTVTADWVFECARSGTKQPELTFSVGKRREPPAEEVSKLCTIGSNQSPSEQDNRVDVSSDVSEEIPPKPLPPNEMPPCEFLPMPRPPSDVIDIRRRLEAKEKAKCLQKAATPFKDRVLRLMETPSKFLRSDVDVSFHLDEVFAMLKTPAHERERLKASIESDTPLSNCVDRFLRDALSGLPDVDDDLAKNLEKLFDVPDEEPTADTEAPQPAAASANLDEDAKPLKGVVLYVCKKLLKQRVDLSHLVNIVGGEFRWTYDSACTHFVFQGKLNDVNREFRLARSQGKIIVSPHWLSACHEAGRWLDEREFPHVYNPNKSIQMVAPSSQPRPKRSKRSLSQSSQASTRTTRSSAPIPPIEVDDVIKKKPKRASEAMTASQETRESLRKTLESIMSSTEKPKGVTTRLSYGKGASYSSPTNLLPLAPPRPPNSVKMTSEPEFSQDVQVMWDDPIGRETREKMLREQNMDSSGEEEGVGGEKQVEETENGEQEGGEVETNVEEDEYCLSQIVREGRIPTFLISSISPEQKLEYASIVERLGGTYLNRDYFDAQTTHLVVKKPARNEKFLASLASGKWILHTSYVEACREANAFVKVLLFVSPRHTPGFIRLLQSGLGQVVGRSIPFPGDVTSLTHAIIDPSRLKEIASRQIEALVEAGVHCCVPEYLAEYLMKDPIPNVEDSYLPDVKRMLDARRANTDS